MGQREQIGKVTLDYSKYSGEDLYCDGAVEDELLEIARNLSPVEYAGVIEERKSWPVLYHLSSLRENIVDWIPLDKGARVLEVGSGCGAVTGALARKAGSVTCVELSKKRSLINAHRHCQCENVTIHVGNFKDIEPDLPGKYDLICLIGVFEYGESYIGGEEPYEDFLRILLNRLAPGGRLVMAIENKYGLKYFAGCREDHLGSYFGGVENYPEGGGVRTFGKKGLEAVFNRAGAEEFHFYYPYPDYKFMTTLYSDDYLPGKGELSNNLRNFDRDRMLLFDEKNAFDGILEEGLFPLFSNSFLAVLGEGFDIKYVKYSNDRAPEYAIRTQIQGRGGESYAVRKYPLTKEAEAHVRRMGESYEGLRERYKGSKLEVNRCKIREEKAEGLFAEFEFVRGTPLSELMDGCLAGGDQEGFYRYFREYRERIGYNSQCPVTDFDLIFSNLLVEGQRWTLIDYEWTFPKPMDVKELAFRAVYCYLLEDGKREKLGLSRILGELSVTEQEAEHYRERERNFQSFVTGKHMSLSQMRELIGRRLMRPQDWIDRYEDSAWANRVQIYEDRGSGYREEESYFVREAYQGENLIEMELSVDGDVRMLRIDPAMDYCAVRILEMTLNGVRVPLERRRVLWVNGRMIRPVRRDGEPFLPSIVFDTADPNIGLDLRELERRGENALRVRMEIKRLSPEMARDLAGAVKKLI